MDDPKIPMVDTWRGVRIDKMPRKDLEAEFIRLATLEAERNRAPYVGVSDVKITTLPILDPHTARVLRELQSVCGSIERGEAGVLESADNTETGAVLTRKMLVVIGYEPPRKP